MAFGNENFKLQYLIDGDARKLKAELASVDKQFASVGSNALTAMKGITAGASLAAAGLAAVGAAGLIATKQLFDLSQQAAEYGSTIFDASQKTGLAAETLSAMDFAAKQSGTSLEAITGSVAKFSKTVGAAIDGSKEARESLLALGIDPQDAMQDLDGALATVFKRINDAKPGIEQITIAQKAFGKSGADLLPFIKSFDGDLAALTKRAKELGVTIDDDAARAADEFGDQLDTLSAQFAAVGRTIGQAFMPIFMDMARATSSWATQNKGEIEQWSNAFAKLTQGMLGDLGRIVQFAKDNEQWIRIALAVMSLGNTERAAALGQMLGARYAQQQRDRGLTGQMGGGISPLIGGGGDTDTGTAPRTRRTTNFDADRAAREAEQRERERIARIRENLRTEIAEKNPR